MNSTSGQAGTAGTAIRHSTTHLQSNILLKTTVGQVSSQDYNITNTNTLFDEGAQRSFITEKLDEELKLKHTGSDTLSLASLGSPSYIHIQSFSTR